MALVTLSTAKLHLNISSTDERDELIRLHIDIAEALVLRYIKEVLGSPADYSTQDDVPRVILGAILEQLAEIHRFRGDDTDVPKRNPFGMLSAVVEGMLHTYRYPTLA